MVMINSIHIKNYILIDELTVDFSGGLNVITGETGAGKSILINAIDIAFGAKVSQDVIKKGCDKALIELFVSPERVDLKDLFEENGIDFSQEVVIAREITPTTSRIRVNGSLVNQNFAKELKSMFVDIHSQHQTYAFLQPKTHIGLLDAYSKDVYGKDLSEYRVLYSEYLKLLKDLEEAEKAADFTESQIDFLKFQINEIEEAGIENINEDEELASELKVLENAEKLKELTYGAYWSLNGEDGNLLDALSQIKSNVSKAVRMDESLSEIESLIIDLSEQARDAAVALRDYSQSVSDDTERLNEIQERIFLLNKLKRKYGITLEEVLVSYENLSKELNAIEYSTQIIDETQKKIDEILKKLTVRAQKISDSRKIQAKTLSELIEKELAKLELAKARFEIRVEDEALSASGKDAVEFFISANVSQDLAPLAKSASGGELSRVMLAIKTVFANADNVDTVIFDEIDTGISGKAAQSVAEEIAQLAKFRQILLITHQAIIASKADSHFLVSKEQNDETTVEIKLLNDDDRVLAIASMASGDKTKSSLDFAKSLLKMK